VRSKLYLETTIVSYLAARPSRDLIVAAHQQLTHDWWTGHRQGYDLYASQLVQQEAAAGDPEAAETRLELLAGGRLLATTGEALALADELVRRGVVPRKVPEDAAHIAIATVNGMDYLLTWNCRHIANARIFKAIEAVCSESGYDLPVICTPEELIGG
jgi:hypothetical protein